MSQSPALTVPVNLLLLLLSALLVFLHPPGLGTQLVGFFAYIPFLVALQYALVHQTHRLRRKIIIALAYSMVLAVPFAWSLDWSIHSLHAFGHLPLLLAWLVVGFGYGLEFCLFFFIGFALPLLVLRRTNGWDLGARLFWMLIVDLLYPRLFQWSFGGITLFRVPFLEQGADLIGAWGLGILVLGSNLLLAAFACRWLCKTHVNKRVLQVQCAVYLLLLVSMTGYGVLREKSLHKAVAQRSSKVVPALNLVSVQPNFSLQHLASNPDLAFSDRVFNMQTLISDSIKGLNAVPATSPHPRLVVWPETAFPWSFFQSPQAQAFIRRFAKEYETAVLLATTDRDVSGDNGANSHIKGLSVLIDAEGNIAGIYKKIALMPFGEYIPGARLMPWFGQAVQAAFPMISRFEAGTEYSVFRLQNGHAFSATLCFDAALPKVFRNMARKEAGLIINLVNLAWFGESKASTHMEMVMRWRAIENRIPVMMSSLNGETQLITAQGRNQGERLPLFTAGVWNGVVRLDKHQAFYREYSHLVQWAAACAWILCVFLGHFYGRIFAANDQSI